MSYWVCVCGAMIVNGPFDEECLTCGRSRVPTGGRGEQTYAMQPSKEIRAGKCGLGGPGEPPPDGFPLPKDWNLGLVAPVANHPDVTGWSIRIMSNTAKQGRAPFIFRNGQFIKAIGGKGERA